MKKAIKVILLIVTIITLMGMASYIYYAKILGRGHVFRCSPLPEVFSASELTGTWMAGTPDQSDTLIIKADGTYKQIVHVEFTEEPTLDYQSDWQTWHVDYSDQHIGYLHLEGFRFCGMNPEIPCNKRNGGGYDFCRDEWVNMENEGILLVFTGKNWGATSTEEPQNTIWLAYSLGSEESWTY